MSCYVSGLSRLSRSMVDVFACYIWTVRFGTAGARRRQLFFHPLFITPTSLSFGHIPTHNTSLYVVPAKEAPFGVRKMKLEI